MALGLIVQILALGMDIDTEFVYAKVGWQPAGTHKGERGVALVVGRFDRNSGTVSADEEAFFEPPYRDSALRTLFLPERNQVYLNNNTTIWRSTRPKGNSPYSRAAFLTTFTDSLSLHPTEITMSTSSTKRTRAGFSFSTRPLLKKGRFSPTETQ